MKAKAKRIASWLTTAALITGILCLPNAAAADEIEVENMVKDFLQCCTENMYMYEDNEFLKQTSATWSQQELQNFKSNTEKLISARTAYLLPDEYEKTEQVIAAAEEFPQFINTKVNFLKYYRQKMGITRHDFRVNYEITDVSLIENFATVTLYESIFFYYDDLDEETFKGTWYKVCLYKTGTKWIIYDVWSNDPFDGDKTVNDLNSMIDMIDKCCQDEQTQKAVLTAMDQTQKVELAAEIEAVSAQARENMDAVANAASAGEVIPYNASDAINYAYTYTTTTGSNTLDYYNKNFPDFKDIPGGSDCANFVSQCIWAGFGGSDNETSLSVVTAPMDKSGSMQWWCTPSNWDKSTSWSGVEDQAIYVENSDQSPSTEDAVWFADYPTLYEIRDIKSTDSNDLEYNKPVSILYSGIQPGDALMLTANNGYFHSVFISKITGNTINDIYYCAHDTDVKSGKLIDDFRVNSSGYQISATVATPGYFFGKDVSHTHSYTSISTANGIDATCNYSGCSYVRLKVSVPTKLTTMQYKYGNLANNTVTIKGNCNLVPYRMSAKVERYLAGSSTPYTTHWLGDVYGTSIYSKSYEIMGPGLFRVTIYARDKNPDSYNDSKNVSYSYAFRVWQ